MTTEEAMRDWLETKGFVEPGTPRSEWYADNWVRVAMFGRRVPVFPIYGFKKTLFLHDIHHLLADYDTDFRGELEIAAWELSSGGCGWHILYWPDRFFFMTLGLLIAPLRTLAAFKRGWRHRNIFDRDPQEVMGEEFATLRLGTLEPS